MKLIAKLIILILMSSYVLTNFPKLANSINDDGTTYQIQVIQAENKIYLVSKEKNKPSLRKLEVYDIALKYPSDVIGEFVITVQTRQLNLEMGVVPLTLKLKLPKDDDDDHYDYNLEDLPKDIQNLRAGLESRGWFLSGEPGSDWVAYVGINLGMSTNGKLFNLIIWNKSMKKETLEFGDLSIYKVTIIKGTQHVEIQLNENPITFSWTNNAEKDVLYGKIQKLSNFLKFINMSNDRVTLIENESQASKSGSNNGRKMKK
jgi:hypothetical protein